MNCMKFNTEGQDEIPDLYKKPFSRYNGDLYMSGCPLKPLVCLGGKSEQQRVR